MTAAVIALAVIAAGLAATTVALAIRALGLRGDVEQARLQLAAAVTSAADSRAAADLATVEAAHTHEVAARLASAHQAELDELREIAARCAGPEEIRAWLGRLTSKGAT
jgi:hypothetical protein